MCQQIQRPRCNLLQHERKQNWQYNVGLYLVTVHDKSQRSHIEDTCGIAALYNQIYQTKPSWWKQDPWRDSGLIFDEFPRRRKTYIYTDSPRAHFGRIEWPQIMPGERYDSREPVPILLGLCPKRCGQIEWLCSDWRSIFLSTSWVRYVVGRRSTFLHDN
jgi:hypothetical protein